MPDYHRNFVPGGTFFFTVVTHRRREFLTDELARGCLRQAIDEIRKNRPFAAPAFVLLPEHLHVMWTLPRGDANYPTRWRRIKEEFTERYLDAGGIEADRSASRISKNERGIWQRRYWEHTISDEHDYERHFDYIHYNPVKHGHVKCPRDWKFSSFHRWQAEGIYERDWGCISKGEMDFGDLDETAMEFE